MSEHDANAEMGRLERELEEARERLSDLSRTGGETKLASSTGPRPMLAMVPQEQWDAIRERLASTERERDVLQLQLDAIRGLATGQPGSDPSSSDQGWSPALCAVKALVRERDEARDEAERLAKKGDVYREAWHVIESALDGAGGLSPKHSPEEARDFIVRVIRERDRLREYVERLEAALVRLHEIYAWGVQQNDDDEHETWWKAALECVALGREIAQRRKKGGRDVGTDL